MCFGFVVVICRGTYCLIFTVSCTFLINYWVSTESVRRLQRSSPQTTVYLYTDPQDRLSDVVINRPESKRIFILKPACSRKFPKIGAKTIMLCTIIFDQRVVLECPSDPWPSSCRVRCTVYVLWGLMCERSQHPQRHRGLKYNNRVNYVFHICTLSVFWRSFNLTHYNQVVPAFVLIRF